MNAMRGLASFREDLTRAGSVEKAMATWLERLRSVEKSDPAIWISRFSNEQLLAEAARLDQKGNRELPLFGIPFAVKDNIDVAGLPTTAACPGFLYEPQADAPVVALLREAGALCVGKTNLDQFATGLVGTRSPYGIPRNACQDDLIPGGSSSGSAVAVARGLVPFSVGTDTAGSGRVPAALNGIYGWKPTRGMVSTRGVVPACRSLDCVSFFGASAEDLQTLKHVTGVFDALDPFSRREPIPISTATASINTIAIPQPAEMEFYGDEEHRQAWLRAVEELRQRGVSIVEAECKAFFEAGRLLYEGPWVAERYRVVRRLLQENPGALHPVTREVISRGAVPKAWEAFAAIEQLAALRRQSEALWERADALCLPTTGTIYRVARALEDPIRLNSRLGYYTNFVNLLDLCAVAFPGGCRKDGLPFGLSLVAPAWHDARLLHFVAGKAVAPAGEKSVRRVELAVFGAHMRGMPLCCDLESLGGEFLREEHTASVYRMVALDEKRPGVVRVPEDGCSLELEVWSLPVESVGLLLEQIPAPLGLGKVRLQDGKDICGFLCEQWAIEGKPDISSYRGWRAFQYHLAAR